MSIKLMSEIWDNEDPGLSGSRLNILLCLADHANDDGVCWPSIPRIAKRVRIDRNNGRNDSSKCSKRNRGYECVHRCIM